ncbi:MAG TPA: FAD-dependent oxidoreductase, partial [Thermodesulfobacteriota bacterium]|nr:FAD-dependent oxidoreductase [Thermodesulfobacteriota bacterium]
MSASLPEKADVLVVGAGPAGSTLARDLAASGVDVVIIDKARFPRGKTCGGGVNVRVQKLLPFDLTPVVEQVITGISFTCNFESPFVRRSPEPLILTVRRETFDSFLLDRAREAGARFFERSACLALRAQGDSVEVETSAGICRARYVAGADGALGFTARRMNGGKEEGCLLAVHSEAPDSMLPDWDPTLIHIDWGSVKRSYAYLFPKKHFLSMGAGGFGVPSVQIKKYHRAYMATRWQKEATLPFSAAG